MLVAGAYGGAAATDNEGKRDVMRLHGEWLIRTARPPVEQQENWTHHLEYVVDTCYQVAEDIALTSFILLWKKMVPRSLQLCTLTH